MKTTYQKLRERIVEECPELLELSFGCRIKLIDEKKIIKIVEDDDKRILCVDSLNWRYYAWLNNRKIDSIIPNAGNEKIEKFKIIGHPISLHYVLRAICKIKPDIAIMDEEKKYIKVATELGKLLYAWDFSKEDNLEVQLQNNKELGRFLEEIIL